MGYLLLKQVQVLPILLFSPLSIFLAHPLPPSVQFREALIVYFFLLNPNLLLKWLWKVGSCYTGSVRVLGRFLPLWGGFTFLIHMFKFSDFKFQPLCWVPSVDHIPPGSVQKYLFYWLNTTKKGMGLMLKLFLVLLIAIYW